MRVAIEGRELELEAHGPEAGRVLLFLHGLTTDRRLLVETFEPALSVDRGLGVPDGWRRLYVDLPGHGGSPADGVEASADGLVALLALGLARELPGLAGLFLVNPTVEPDVALRTLPPRRIAALEEGLAFADDEEREAFTSETTVQTAEMLERFRRLVDRAHRATDRTFLAALRGRYAHSAPWGPALRALDAPVHVVCGQDDHWAGYSDALALVRLAPRCRFTVLPGCGPFLPLEAGESLARLFGEWGSALR